MSGLVGYGSSDEEVEEAKESTQGLAKVPSTNAPSLLRSGIPTNGRSGNENGSSSDGPVVGPVQTSFASNGSVIGPMAGPQLEEAENGTISAPQSPYSTTRAVVRDLTLPTVPNFNIPDSPPGSPPPGMEKKLSHFLELKKQGVHFNEKVANSSALKNPSILGKLMTFAGLEESNQYATTLPKELWDPQGFPPWAYHEELAKAQDEAQKEREKEMARTQRETIDFVSASGQASMASAAGGRGLKGSAAERVMAGLDRTRTASPQASNSAASGDNFRRRSRSPGRRRRSRSR